MKKVLFFLSLIVMMAFSVQAQAQKSQQAKNAAQKTQTLEIVKLNTKTIKIGNKTYKVGDKFSDSEEIHWSSAKQEMWVKYTGGRDREKKCLSKESFVKRKVKTPKEYFQKVNHPSAQCKHNARTVQKKAQKYREYKNHQTKNDKKHTTQKRSRKN